MTVADTVNGWNPSADNMQLIANDTWQYNVVFNNATNFQFKFTADGNWNTNWGGNGATEPYPPFSGTGVSAGQNIPVSGALNGLYQFTFTDTDAAYSLVPLQASPYAGIYIPGTYNGWNAATNEMQLVANDLWQETINFSAVTNLQFKFDANGGWGTNWGQVVGQQTQFAVPLAGTASPNNPLTNIVINGVLNGNYIFTFNDQSSNFTVTAISSSNDGIPDNWRTQYFGTNALPTNALDCATCDADGTGQNNLFKYVAGLDPTNPASVFVLLISAPASQPATKNLTFGPIAAGRIYTPLIDTNLPAGLWSVLGGYTGPTTNGASQATITDTNATHTNEFYRINITLP